MAVKREDLLRGLFCFFTDTNDEKSPVIISGVGKIQCEICFILTGESKVLPFDGYCDNGKLISLKVVDIFQVELFLREKAEIYRKEREDMDGHKWGIELKTEVLLVKMAGSHLAASDLVSDAKDLLDDKADFEDKLLKLIDNINAVSKALIAISWIVKIYKKDAIRIVNNRDRDEFIKMICKQGG